MTLGRAQMTITLTRLAVLIHCHSINVLHTRLFTPVVVNVRNQNLQLNLTSETRGA